MEAVKAKIETLSSRLKSQEEAVPQLLDFFLNNKVTDLLLIFIRNIILYFSLPALYSEILQRSKIRFKDQMSISQGVPHSLIVSI